MMQPTPNESRIHTDELVDIREVSVDKNLPKEERIAAFLPLSEPEPNQQGCLPRCDHPRGYAAGYAGRYASGRA